MVQSIKQINKKSIQNSKKKDKSAAKNRSTIKNKKKTKSTSVKTARRKSTRNKKKVTRLDKLDSIWDTIFKRDIEGENREIIESIESTNNLPKQNDKPVIILLHATWCGHCDALKPEWSAMKDEINKELRDKIIIEEIEDSEMDHKMPIIRKSYLNGKKIDFAGYPTVGSIRNSKFEQYGGARTADSLIEWARQLLV
jgi:thiol-disulfide isomerase/thioredoxin